MIVFWKKLLGMHFLLMVTFVDVKSRIYAYKISNTEFSIFFDPFLRPKNIMRFYISMVIIRIVKE